MKIRKGLKMRVKDWHQKAQKEFYKRAEKGEIPSMLSESEWNSLQKEIYAKCKLIETQVINTVEPVLVRATEKIVERDCEYDKQLIVSLQNELEQVKEVLAEAVTDRDNFKESCKSFDKEANELRQTISVLTEDIGNKDFVLSQHQETIAQLKERLEQAREQDKLEVQEAYKLELEAKYKKLTIREKAKKIVEAIKCKLKRG